MNSLKGCDLTLKRVASGIRSWGAFCDMSGGPHLLPTEAAAIAWSAYFCAGRTFRQYPHHSEKACIPPAIQSRMENKGSGTGSKRPGEGRVQTGCAQTRRPGCVVRQGAQICVYCKWVGWTFFKGPVAVVTTSSSGAFVADGRGLHPAVPKSYRRVDS